MLNAKWAPVLSVGSRIAGYCGGVVLSRFSTLSPSALLSLYPSKSFVQLYHALYTLPALITAVIWWLLLNRSPLVALIGTLRVLFGSLAVYITAEDSVTWHGDFAVLYVALTLAWMWLVTVRFKSTHQQARRKLTISYLVVLFTFMHFQGRFLSGGHGYYKVLALRLLQIGLDLSFELLAFYDFDGVYLRVDYSRKFDV